MQFFNCSKHPSSKLLSPQTRHFFHNLISPEKVTDACPCLSHTVHKRHAMYSTVLYMQYPNSSGRMWTKYSSACAVLCILYCTVQYNTTFLSTHCALCKKTILYCTVHLTVVQYSIVHVCRSFESTFKYLSQNAAKLPFSVLCSTGWTNQTSNTRGVATAATPCC